MLSVRCIAAIIICFTFLTEICPGPARAQGAAGGVQGSSGAPAGSAPQTPVAPLAVGCDMPGVPRASDLTPISVTLNAATAWQPRSGEVLIEVKGDSTNFAGLSFRACFGWSSGQSKDYFSAENLKTIAWTEGFVMLRPSDRTGILNLGITVPRLDPAPTGIFDRWFSHVRSSGLGLVPVADMRLIAYTKDRVVFDEVRPVGITSVLFAFVVAASALVTGLMLLHRFATGSPPPAPGVARPSLMARLKAAASFNWVLTLVQAPDGRSSLSAFQILLWTLVVAVSAMYVMALSGNLINVTPGTLTLLGIAGAAGVIAGVSDAAATKPRVAPSGTTRQWRDLVVDPVSGTPDITRMQMLLFTIVSAIFVIVQVANYYVMPDIPTGYQLLMGISNSVYVGRKISNNNQANPQGAPQGDPSQQAGGQNDTPANP